MVKFVIEDIGCISCKEFVGIGIIEILVVALQQLQHIFACQNSLYRLVSRDSHQLIKTYQSRARRRHNHLYVHYLSIVVGYRQEDILAIFDFLQRILKIYLIPNILIGIQLESISLPICPIKVNSRSTCFSACCLHIHTERDILVAGQLQIEIANSRIYQFAQLSKYLFWDIQRYADIASWHFHFAIGNDTIVASYGHASLQGSGFICQVFERQLSIFASFVKQTHWELIPLSTCSMFDCITRNHFSCS